jgi:hypothetical protein
LQAKLPARFFAGERIIGFQLSRNGDLRKVFLMFREWTAQIAFLSIRGSRMNCLAKGHVSFDKCDTVIHMSGQ